MPRLPPRSLLLGSAGAAVALALVLAACQSVEFSEPPPQQQPAPNPQVVERIRAFEAGERNAQVGLISFAGPDGRPVYLFSTACCDMHNPLYDADGRRICVPSGGFSGDGDGQCPAWVHAMLQPPTLRPPGLRQQPWPPR
jgi:hypothetical protein